MANSYKNILITPNIGSSVDTTGPTLNFSGANTVVNTDITMTMYPSYGGTLSFDGTSGQLFSIVNDMTNLIFNVADISGIPMIQAYASGNLAFMPVSGKITVGNSTFNVTSGYNSTNQTVAEYVINSNTFGEIAIYNSNTGNNASADIIVNDTAGLAPTNPNYIDLGVNGSGFLQSSWTINGPSDGYLYTGNTNLSIGTAGAKYLNFFTGNTLIANERMRITPTGNVGIGNTAPVHLLSVAGITYFGGNVVATGSVGYTTGAGATITQLTTRTTGVTISKPSGMIALVSAAGSTTPATFTVTNSFVANTDTIILNQRTGTNIYILLVSAVGTGSFNITQYTTGGVTSESPQINFNVIKGINA
jgi:hypothetical protein